jgi:hypothetical protein
MSISKEKRSLQSPKYPRWGSRVGCNGGGRQRPPLHVALCDLRRRRLSQTLLALQLPLNHLLPARSKPAI